MKYRTPRQIKQALLNGVEVKINKWAALINKKDEVEIWDPKGKGVVASLIHLDRAVKDFYKLAQGIPEKMPKPVTYESTPSGSGPLGDDTSQDKPWTDPKVNTQPVMQGPTGDPDLKDDTSQDVPWTDPAVNTRPQPNIGEGGLPDTDLGKDTQKNKVEWEDKLTGPGSQQAQFETGKNMKARKKRAEEGEYIGNIGDVNWLEYGGTLIFQDGDRLEATHVDPWMIDAGEVEDEYDPNMKWEVFNYTLDKMQIQDGKLVDEYGHDDWWTDEETLASIASFVGQEVEELKQSFTSDDPMELAWAYEAIGMHHGFIELDPYPQMLTREEMKNRFEKITGEEIDLPEDEEEDEDFDIEASRRRRSQDMDPGDSGKEEMGTTDPDEEFHPEIEYEPHQIENKGETPSDLPNDLGGRNNARRRAQEGFVDTFDQEATPKVSYQDLVNASPSRDMLKNIADPERWAASQAVQSFASGMGRGLYKDPEGKRDKANKGMSNMRGKDPDEVEAGCDYPEKKEKKSRRRKAQDDFNEYEIQVLGEGEVPEWRGLNRDKDPLNLVLSILRSTFGSSDYTFYITGYGVDEVITVREPAETDLVASFLTDTLGASGSVDQGFVIEMDRDSYDALLSTEDSPRKVLHRKFKAGPRLKENWTTDGGYSRDIEAESPEELYHLTRSFGTDEDYDWSSIRPQEAVEDPGNGLPVEAKQAVDDKAKSYWRDYFNDYGEDLVKDDSTKKNRKELEPKVDETPKPAGQQKVKAQAAPAAPPEAAPPGGQMTDPETAPQTAPQAPAAPAAPAKPEKAPGAGDEGLKALGWTPEEIKLMNDEDKQKILQVQLKKPGTGAAQAPTGQPKPPAKPAPEAPQAGPAPMPAQPEQGMPAPTARRVRAAIYEVVVGNIGTVETTENHLEAFKVYLEYKQQSESGYGRAAGESVTLFEDGEPIEEHFGEMDFEEDREASKRMPAPTARRLKRESKERLKIAKAFRRLAQVPAEQGMTPPAPQTSPSQPVTAPAAPAPAEPAVSDEFAGEGGSDFTPETEAMAIYNEILQKEVKASSPEQVPALKSQELVQRLLTEVGMPMTEARQLFGLKSGDGFNKLFQ